MGEYKHKAVRKGILTGAKYDFHASVISLSTFHKSNLNKIWLLNAKLAEHFFKAETLIRLKVRDI